jgi:hypothetical protein
MRGPRNRRRALPVQGARPRGLRRSLGASGGRRSIRASWERSTGARYGRWSRYFAADPSLPAALALLVLAGACGLYSLGLDGRVRDAAPQELFARAMTLNTAGLMTLQGLGFVLAGALAQAVGSANAIALAGCCGIAATVMLMGRELRPARSAGPATDITR